MASDDSGSDFDFEDQLRQEALEQEKKKAIESGEVPTRVDPDGTVYDWDPDKKAWFPKLDDSFLANYQMNYGVPEEDEATKALRLEREEQWRIYYEKVAASQAKATNDNKPSCKESTNGNEASSQSANDNEGTGGSDGDDETEQTEAETNEAWQNYYNSDAYREWYGHYYSATQTSSVTSGSNNNDVIRPDGDVTASKEDKIPGACGIKVSDSASETPLEEMTEDEKKELKKKKRKQQSQPSWYEVEESKNTHVYVQGLPLDMSDEEFLEMMSKCGMIMNEPFSEKKRAKVYRDAEGNSKGDGRCCYIKVESVDLAMQIVDGSVIRGSTIHVEKARFQLKGEFDPTKRRKLTNKEKKKLKEHQENLFRWAPDKSRFERSKKERAVVVKNAFTQAIFDADPLKLPELKQRMEQECSKCGAVKRVIVHDTNQEGVVTIWFTTAEEADIAVTYLNKAIFYNGRVLSAQVWDGKTKYDVEETPEDRERRLAQWNAYLEGGGSSNSTNQEGLQHTNQSEPSSQAIDGSKPETSQCAVEPEKSLPDDEDERSGYDDEEGRSTDSNWIEGADSDDNDKDKQES